MGIFEQQAMQIAKVKELTTERRLSNKTDDVDFDPPTPEPEYWWERAERNSGMTAKDFK